MATLGCGSREHLTSSATRRRREPHAQVVRYGDGLGPIAVAHRGGAGLAGENSLAAFAMSHALGLRHVETDVRLTRDGVPVLVHDATLRRTHGIDRAVADLVRRDLLDDLLTLADALDLFPDTGVALDVKDLAAAPAIADTLRHTASTSRVCVAGAWDRTLAALAVLAGPDLSVAMGWRSLLALIAASRTRAPLIRRGRSSFAHVPLRLGRLPVFAEQVVHRAHRIGVRVLVWTVDDPATMHHLLDAGADGLITDRPDLLREVLLSRDQWPAPPMRDRIK